MLSELIEEIFCSISQLFSMRGRLDAKQQGLRICKEVMYLSRLELQRKLLVFSEGVRRMWKKADLWKSLTQYQGRKAINFMRQRLFCILQTSPLMGHHKALMQEWLGSWFEQAAEYFVSVFSLAWRLLPCANKGPFSSTLTCKSAHSACSFPVFKQHLYMKNMSQYSPPFPLLCFRIRNGICGLTLPPALKIKQSWQF